MPGRILDGRKIGAEIRADAAEAARAFALGGRPPGLAVVLIGDDPASAIYVRGKIRASKEAGIRSETHRLDAGTSGSTLGAMLDRLNDDETVDAILLQLPLPGGLDAAAFLSRIRPDKDVDGFHPENVGRLVANAPGPRPCTPAGIMEMFRREGIEVRGSRAVVVGRSDIVGKPLALLLLHGHATVTVCHSRTRDLAGVCSEADILCTAIGRPALLGAEAIRPGAVVVDVGMNRAESEAEVRELFGDDERRLARFRRSGYTLVGDVHPLAMRECSSAYTPVPGGVGPLTIAMLLANTVALAAAPAAPPDADRPWKKRPAVSPASKTPRIPRRSRRTARLPRVGGANRQPVPSTLFRGEGETPPRGRSAPTDTTHGLPPRAAEDGAVLRVGLTGGIASGKTTVRRVFERSGIPMLDADALTHALLAPGGELVETIARAFGPEVVDSSGGIDRKVLGARVFANRGDRERLNGIVHPRVRERIASFLDRRAREGHRAAGVEAALMLETGSAAIYDRVVVVHCRPEQQIGRLVARSGMSIEEARLRLAAQMAPDEKARRGSDLVDASGPIAETETAAAALAARLRAEGGAPEAKTLQ